MNQAVSPEPSIAQASQPSRARQLRMALGAAGSVAVLGAALYVWQGMRFHEQTDDAYVRADWAPVSARVGGYVAQVCVDDNAWVKAGDLLATIDSRPLQAQLAQRVDDVVAGELVVAQVDGVLSLSGGGRQQGFRIRVLRTREYRAPVGDLDDLLPGLFLDAQRRVFIEHP